MKCEVCDGAGWTRVYCRYCKGMGTVPDPEKGTLEWACEQAKVGNEVWHEASGLPAQWLGVPCSYPSPRHQLYFVKCTGEIDRYVPCDNPYLTGWSLKPPAPEPVKGSREWAVAMLKRGHRVAWGHPAKNGEAVLAPEDSGHLKWTACAERRRGTKAGDTYYARGWAIFDPESGWVCRERLVEAESGTWDDILVAIDNLSNAIHDAVKEEKA